MNVLEIDLANSRIGEAIKALAAETSWDSIDARDLNHMVNLARTLVGHAQVDGVCSVPDELAALTRGENGTAGLAILRGLPRLPEPRRTFLILAEIMGKVVRYEDEGDYLIEVKEDPTSAVVRPGFNNSKEFFPHTDLSYIEFPPQFFCLHSLSNERAQGGFSEFADVADLTSYMPLSTVAQLEEDHYLFPAPIHYRGGGAVRRAILEPGAYGEHMIRFRRDSLRSTTRTGINAIIDLCRAIQETMIEVFLEPDSVAVINNRRVLHGRTAFLGGALTSMPRHINRLYFKVN